MRLFKDINKVSPFLRAKIAKLSRDMHLFYAKSAEERDKILDRIRKNK